MGLAPYGEPKYASLILDNLIHINDDGSFWLDQSYFDYCVGLRMTNEKFSQLFGQPVRRPEKDLLTQFHMDVAASIQAVTDQWGLTLARALSRETQARNRSMATVFAFNRLANVKLPHHAMVDACVERPARVD